MIKKFQSLILYFQSHVNSNTAAFVSMINTLRATDHFNKVLFSGFVKKVRML